LLASSSPQRVCVYDVEYDRFSITLDGRGQPFLFAGGGNHLVTYRPNADEFRVYRMPGLMLKKTYSSPIPQLIKSIGMGWGNPHRALVCARDGNDSYFYSMNVNDGSHVLLESTGGSVYMYVHQGKENKLLQGNMGGSYYVNYSNNSIFSIAGDTISMNKNPVRQSFQYKTRVASNDHLFGTGSEICLCSGRLLRSEFEHWANLPDPSGRFFINTDIDDESTLFLTDVLDSGIDIDFKFSSKDMYSYPRNLNNCYFLPEYHTVCQVHDGSLHRTEFDISKIVDDEILPLADAKTYFILERGSRLRESLSQNIKEDMEIRLIWGPKNLTVDENGLINWRPPRDAEFEELIIEVLKQKQHKCFIFCGIAIEG